MASPARAAGLPFRRRQDFRGRDAQPRPLRAQQMRADEAWRRWSFAADVSVGRTVTDEMAEFLQRLLQAMPDMRGWIAELHATHYAKATRVDRLSFARMTSYWPPSFLEQAQAVTVENIPFPPVSAYGLPEFESLAAMPLAGITFGNMYFIHEAHLAESVHFHELVHVAQWRVLGMEDFLLTYALGVAHHGYAQSPLEAMAFEAQSTFERGLQLPGLIEAVQARARETRDKAAAVFRTAGLRLGA